MRGIARLLVLSGLTVSATVFGAGGVPPGAAGDICAPRSVSVHDAWAPEGDPPGGGMLTFTVSTAGCAGGTVLYQAVAGAAGLAPATAGFDFVVKSGKLTWAPGESADQMIGIAVIGDLADEANEGITLQLSSPTGLSISDDTARGTIADDDVELGFASQPFCLEICVTCWLVVESREPVPTDVTVYFTTRNGSAVGGTDFVPVQSSVTIPRGARRAEIGIRILDNTITEPDEQFTVTILGTSTGRIGNGTATVTIGDDDGSSPPAGLPS